MRMEVLIIIAALWCVSSAMIYGKIDGLSLIGFLYILIRWMWIFIFEEMFKEES